MTTSKTVSGITAFLWMSFAVLQALPIVASAQIEEVIVSTRRKEENLQDVPISVSAISSEEIQRDGITDLADVVQNQPSVQFDQAFGPADNRITIRGLSNTRGRSNVAFLVDGIDVTTENLVSAGSGLLANRRLLTDVERIEIVKGPQSALYGRSAFAGAISYVTKEPGNEFNGRVNVDVGDYGRRSVDGAVGGPLTDTFGVRLAGVSFNEDGYYSNSLLGSDVGGSNGYGAALTMVWKPADAVKVKTRFEYSEENYDPRAGVNIQGDKAYVLPDNAKVIPRPVTAGAVGYTPFPGTNVNNPDGAASSATNLFNFGTYCPKFGFDPGNPTGQPGICLPGKIKNGDDYTVAQSENPVTGDAYPGTDTTTFGASLIATFDLGYGLVSSYTGWTDFDSRDLYDQDYQASAAYEINGVVQRQRAYGTSNPEGGRTDTLLGAQESNQESSTYQFSQEFRYETEWDGPLKLTGGVLFWRDHRALQDRNNITSCAPYARINALALKNADGEDVKDVAGNVLTDPTTGNLVYVSGICDGTDGTVTSWQQYRRQVAYPQYATQWDARVQHLSFYGRVDWEMTEDLTLALEDRVVSEEFNLTKPGSSSCTEIAFAMGPTGIVGRPQTTSPAAPWLEQDRTFCDIERLVGIGPYPPLIDIPTGFLSLRYLEGTTTSHYNTPKVTLSWKVLEDTNVYFSWAFAEKPGGINQLTGGGGGVPPTLAQERFDPEKLEAWEFGVKTGFEAAGFWRLNSALFLQDYSDKQVGIQIERSGTSQPAVVNAAAAQNWGFEFEATWQPSLMDGLTLMLSGTIQDPKYTSWTDDSRNLVKAAVYGSCPVIYKLQDPTSTDFKDQLESTNPVDPIFGGAVPQANCRFDYGGNQLERAPKQAYAASMSIQRPFMETPFEYLFELSGSWQDERWAEPENLVLLSSYALMDVRLGLTSDKWDVIAYVDNVLDDSTFKTAGSGPDFGSQVTDLGFLAGFGTTHYFGTLPDPRVFGIRGAYRFGGSQ